MSTSKRSRIILSLVSVLPTLALSAQAQESRQPQGQPSVQTSRPAPARTGQVRAPLDARYARAGVAQRNFGGHAYHGRLAWEGGRWRHETHNGRLGWWWDVGGVWYFYPQPMEGPPTYVSEVEFVDVVDGPPVAAGYPAPPVAYAPPPPPPPPPDPAASAVGGAILGGVLGGLLTGRPGGAAVGAIAGGTAGAIAGATAASRPGYYLAQGNCYYRYPSGQYVLVDSRTCY